MYNTLVSQLNTANGVILGDFNADCSYLSNSKYARLSLVNDSRFVWLINSTTDTTTSPSECSYDRIVVARDIARFVVNGSAGVFRFDVEYGLDAEQTLLVSDHYPVEFSLQGQTTSSSGHLQCVSYAGSLVGTFIMILLSSFN